MSQSQVSATAQLCRFLESSSQDFSGMSLSDAQSQRGIDLLLHERLMGFGMPLNFVNCPECGVELARVDRVLSGGRMRLMCHGECEDFEAPVALRQTYKLNVTKLVERLSLSLDCAVPSIKVIEDDRLWRLGRKEPLRGKVQTWYFARQLHDHSRAWRLREHIRADQALQTAKIITSSEAPLPEGSPLMDFAIVNLSAVARLSQNRFMFFTDSMDIAASAGTTGTITTTTTTRARQTTLVDVRERGIVHIDGQRVSLEPMQKKILLALMDDFDHRMEGALLRDKCGSRAATFQPVKYFERNKQVFDRFIRYVPGDKEYELLISVEDSDWLS